MQMVDSQLDEAAQVLVDNGFGGPFACAMILGTGLGNLANDLEGARELPYSKIPGFPTNSVSGHEGRIVAGKLEGREVLIFQGRAHYYETGDAAAMRIPIALLAALGSPPLIITNACGSLNFDIRPGSLVSIKDHINFSGLNPLIGETGDARFVSMVDAYDSALRQKLKRAAIVAGITMNEGIYMWFSGPSFETPAEVKMAKMLGADLVGMSTVPEVIIARRYNIRVVAISVVTNLAVGIEGANPTHAETRGVAAMSLVSLRRVLRTFMNVFEHA
jgi:purine-nucleoside phosphorylase